MQAPEQAPEQEQGGGQMGQLVMNIGKGLSILAGVMEKVEGVPDAMKAEMGDIMTRFEALVQGLSGGQAAPGEEEQAPAAQQSSPRSKPVPMQSMAGKPSGPAGV